MGGRRLTLGSDGHVRGYWGGGGVKQMFAKEWGVAIVKRRCLENMQSYRRTRWFWNDLAGKRHQE